MAQQRILGRASGTRIKHGRVKECGHSRWTRCGYCGCENCMLLPRHDRHVSKTTIWAHGGIEDIENPEDMQDNPFDFPQDEGPIPDINVPIYPVDVAQIMRNFTRRICLDVYRGQTMKQTKRDLERLQLLTPLMIPEVNASLPWTFTQAVALADLPKTSYNTFDVCQNNRCGMVFPNPPPTGRYRMPDRCQGCDTPRYQGSLADHSMLVLDLQRELADFFSDSRRVEMLDYCLNPLEGDVWGGTQLRNISDEERMNTLFLTICCDATDFQKQSWTPVVIKINNLHPEARINKDAMFTLASKCSLCLHPMYCLIVRCTY